jgi:PAS domain-containing protein
MASLGDNDLKFWALLEAVPAAAFIVDGDARILEFNAAAEKLLGVFPKAAIQRRHGDAVHCVCSESLGCGQSTNCAECILRNSVKSALNGIPSRRKFFRSERNHDGRSEQINFFLTAHKLPANGNATAILILEDADEAARLCGLHLKP